MRYLLALLLNNDFIIMSFVFCVKVNQEFLFNYTDDMIGNRWKSEAELDLTCVGKMTSIQVVIIHPNWYQCRHLSVSIDARTVCENFNWKCRWKWTCWNKRSNCCKYFLRPETSNSLEQQVCEKSNLEEEGVNRLFSSKSSKFMYWYMG